MYYYLKFAALIVCLVGLAFCLFRLKQADGAARLNSIHAHYGGGSFTDAVTSFFRQWLWFIPVVAFFVGGVVSCASLVAHESESKVKQADKNNSSENKTPIQQPLIPEKPKLADEAIQNKAPVSDEQLSNIPKPNEETSKVFTKEEVEQMEKEKQYSGDDPIIRKRLGLPPKP